MNTTPVRGHTALFGVYGMLGIGLMLFCLRSLRPGEAWLDRTLAVAFWCINGGLMAMVLLSVLPVGLLQTQASVTHGYWYAAQRGVHAKRRDEHAALATRVWRHDLRRWHRRARAVRLGLASGRSYRRSGTQPGAAGSRAGPRVYSRPEETWHVVERPSAGRRRALKRRLGQI